MTPNTLPDLVALWAEQNPEKPWLRDLREGDSDDYSWRQAN